MNRWPGFTIASLKKHQELIPLFGAVGGGFAVCAAYLVRLTFFTPDVSWNKHGNPEPWQKWKQTDKFKFLSTRAMQGRRFPLERPDMSNEKYSGI